VNGREWSLAFEGKNGGEEEEKEEILLMPLKNWRKNGKDGK
jgi:hypothetical protein